MKKLPIKRIGRKKNKQQVSSRITNETVAEHREQILAGGRRFKYPIQYARHKLVINALLVILTSVIILAALGWQQLYMAQNTSGFMYRLTRAVPVPVAMVDGDQVRFSDYLVQYRGNEFYLSKYDEKKIDSEDGKKQLAHIKRQSLDMAEAYTYAAKLARQKKITVTNDEINAYIDDQRNTANGRISQEAYDASALMLYGWTATDYRLALKHNVVRTKVAFEIDKKADEYQKQAVKLLQENGGDITAAADSLKAAGAADVQSGTTGLLHNTSTYGGLRVSEVSKLEVGQISRSLKSSSDDGYYIVKLLEKNDNQVNFAYVHVPLTEFQNQFDQLKKAGKIKEFISVD